MFGSVDARLPGEKPAVLRVFQHREVVGACLGRFCGDNGEGRRRPTWHWL
jgi:hypothetical protein